MGRASIPGEPHWILVVAGFFLLASVIVGAFSHVRRVRLVAGRVDSTTLANRHRRQIEVPFEAGEPSTCWRRSSASCPAWRK